MKVFRRSKVAVLCALLAVPLLGLPASGRGVQTLTSQGPTDPATGIPTFFGDSAAMHLVPCFAGTPRCFGTQASFLDTSGAPGTGKAFYFNTFATLPTKPAPGVTQTNSSLFVALEAAQPGPTVFQRVRFQIQVPQTGTYTVTYPYGAQQFVVNALSATPGQDINSQTDSPPLTGPIGPFLQWTGAPAPPAGFIGDGSTAHAVTGSPNLRNFFRIQGPGINPNTADAAHSCGAGFVATDCVQTTLFTLQGQIAPQLSASPASMAFPGQVLGTTSAPKTATVTNSGTRPVQIGTVSTTGSGFSSGASGTPANTCTNALIAIGATCTVDITYTAVTGGVVPGTLSVPSNDPTGPLTVALSGSTPAPAFGASPTTLSYGSQPTGTTSAAQTVTVTNTGTLSLTISSVALTGTNPGDFTQTNTCAGGTFAPGATCTATVSFAPTVTGARSASLSFTDNAAGSPHAVALTGTGIPPSPVASISPASITFPGTSTGTTSTAQTVTVTNTGNANLTFTNVALSRTNPGDFTQTNTCATVVPGASCSASVSFSPTVTGARSAALVFTDNAPGSPHSVTLSGTGTVPGTAVNPASLTFASQAQGSTSAAQTVTVTSNGTAAVSVTSVALAGTNAGDFAVPTNGCAGVSLPPGATCTVSVTFAPRPATAPGPATATLNITDSVGTVHPIGLSGNVTAAPIQSVTVNPTSLNFGSTPRNTPTAPQTITVTSTGNTPVSFTSATISGPGNNPRNWAITGDTCTGTTVAPGGTCTISVQFLAVDRGTLPVTLVIVDGAGSQNVSLTGTSV